jgi:hypothetical protein
VTDTRAQLLYLLYQFVVRLPNFIGALGDHQGAGSRGACAAPTGTSSDGTRHSRHCRPAQGAAGAGYDQGTRGSPGARVLVVVVEGSKWLTSPMCARCKTLIAQFRPLEALVERTVDLDGIRRREFLVSAEFSPHLKQLRSAGSCARAVWG